MVVVVDYGSQYTRLLLRLVRKLGNYSEVLPPAAKPSGKVDAVILSGGPRSVYEKGAPTFPEWLKDMDVPVLGVCYGMQLLSKELGGQVKKGRAEYGKAFVRKTKDDPLLEGLPNEFQVWMSHADEVIKPPNGFEILGVSDSGVISIIRKGKVAALQFHLEVHHTCCGELLMENFLRKVANLEIDWKMGEVVTKKIEWIKEVVGNERVIGAVSGGVDSTVAAVLTSRAVGDNFLGIFVDHGLLRKNERKEVEKALKELGVNFITVDASQIFMNRLKGIIDPEEKRKIIGKTFIDVFEEEAKKHKADWLLQGTIYSDVIESGGGHGASKIKSHHNVGGLPERMNLKLLEPLRDLFKDEVREVGKLLGIPEKLIGRHPFPGPGLAVRIPGEVTPEKIRILQEVDDIYIRTLRESGWYEKIWQAFAILLPVKTTGVKGDERDYGLAVSLRAVWSREGMTAEWAKIPHEVLDEISRRILKEVSEVTRVLFDISSKPPATIEWE